MEKEIGWQVMTGCCALPIRAWTNWKLKDGKTIYGFLDLTFIVYDEKGSSYTIQQVSHFKSPAR
jgi:hypothetical protein